MDLYLRQIVSNTNSGLHTVVVLDQTYQTSRQVKHNQLIVTDSSSYIIT